MVIIDYSMHGLKFTLLRIDREPIPAEPKPAEPEDPGSSPGGPATKECLGVIVYGNLSLIYYNFLCLTGSEVRLAPQGLR